MGLNDLYRKIFRKNNIISGERFYKDWVETGRALPPPHQVKQYLVETIQKTTKYNLLIETGTYYGQMIDSQLENFEKIISIELSETLHSIAVEKYKDVKKVILYQGDSGDVLVHLMKTITEPAIFWLDGHYSEGETAKGVKDCPIFEELDAIFSAKKLSHVLLIDDARLFIGINDYPTIKELEEFINMHRPHSNITTEDDMIKIYLN
jgi:hypothetical protein